MALARVKVKLKHDHGTTGLIVTASSIEEAIQIACNAQNAPASSVISAKVEKPTIHDIKRLTGESAPYFFNRRTMKSFEQKMSDFKVYRHGDDKFLIEAKRPYGYTRRIFDPFTNKLEFYEED